MAAGGRPDHERTVGNGFGDRPKFLGRSQDRLGVDGRPRLAKGNIVWMDDSQPDTTEVGHGTGSGSNIKRIAAPDQYDTEAIEFCGREHVVQF